MGETSTVLGNLDLGATYTVGGKATLVLRGGLLLPLGDDDFRDWIAKFVAVYPRVTDVAGAFPNVTWFRGSASALVPGKRLFFKADAGLDVPVDDGGFDPVRLARVNLGVGVVASDRVWLTAELAVVRAAECGGDSEDRCDESLALTARWRMDQLTPYVGAAYTHSPDDDIDRMADFVVLFGVSKMLGDGDHQAPAPR